MKLRLLPIIAAVFGILLLTTAGCTNPFMAALLKSKEKPDVLEITPVSYTVTFDSNGGNPVPSQTVREGEKATRPDNPTKDGFGFVNWYDNAECIEPHYNFDTPVTADIILYAKWSDTFYIVTFDSGGGSEIPIQRVGEGGTASRPSHDPTRDGYTFGGWYCDPDLTDEYDFDSPVVGDITLYAKWIEKAAITITITVEQMTDLSFDDIDGGIIYRNADPTSIRFEYEDDDTDSYTCKWTIDGVGAYAGLITLSTTNSCTVDATKPQYNSIGKHAVYLTVVKNGVPYKKAIWVTIMGGDIYTVSFDTNGGSPTPAQDIIEGGKATRPENPTMSAFGFVDWYDNADLTGSHYDFNTPVTGNITLYAKWSNNFYTVTFNSNGGSAVPSQLVVEGGRASRPMSNPTKEDYAFGGWYGDSALTALYDFDTPVTGTVTLYARWLAFFTVSFDTDGGSAVASKQVVEGGKASRPQNPTKADLSFENWYSNSALTALYNFNTPVTGNITLYAKWVTYNEADFGAGATITTINGVSNTTQWDNAVSTIKGGGSNKNYIINVIGNFNVAGSTSTTFGSVTGIKVSLRGVGRTVGLSSNGALIRTNTNQTVILRDLTLQGRSSNNRQIVWVPEGAFVMHSGKITGNTSSGNVASGVNVGGGSFTMYGGEISGNTCAGGAGVYVNLANSSFTMYGGEISGNTTTGSGGGVQVAGGNTFTMYGGEISGNNSGGSGGGVYVYNSSGSGISTMHGGIISGNTAVDGGGMHISYCTFTMNGGEISGNTVTGNGGGVYMNHKTFTMNGGEISDNTASSGGGVYMDALSAIFTMNDGEISGNTAKTSGGGMYLNSGSFRIVTGTIYGSNEAVTSLKNTATTSGAALFKIANRTAQRGTFSGDTWVSSGDLVTTEDTIRVQNGEMQ